MIDSTRAMIFRSLVLVLSLAAGVAGGADELRWKFNKGDQYAVKLKQQTAIATIVKSKPVRFTIDISLEMDWKVVASTEKQSADVEQTFRRIVVAMNSPGGDPLEYDSAAKELTRKQKNFASGLAPLIGKSLTLSVSPLGVVQKVSVSADLKKHLQSIGDQSRLKALLSEEGLTEFLRGSLVQLPEKAVAATDQWQDEDTVQSSLGKLTRKRNYTYGGNGEINLESQISIETGGPKIEIKKQSQTGKFDFDVAAGRLKSSTVTQKLTTETPYRDLKIQTTVETTQEMTIQSLPANSTND